MAPANASAPPISHTPRIAAGFGTSCATMTGTKKMPPPMTFEMTTAAASSGPSRRTSPVAVEGLRTLLGQELPRNVEAGDLDPLRGAVLREDVHAHVLEVLVLQHVGAGLRRIGGESGRGLEGERRRLVTVERHALHVLLVPVFFRRGAGRHRGAGRRQFLERDVERERPEAVGGALGEPEGDRRNDLVAAVDDAGIVVADDLIADLQRLLEIDGLRT